MRRATLLVLISLLVPAAVFAQAPAATKVAVIDFQAALANNLEGKRAQEKLGAEVTKRQGEMEKIQKDLEDAQTKLRTQDRALSDAAKADLSRDMDRMNTELQRKNDDAQKELTALQQELLRPIAERVQKILQAYVTEMGYAVVLDAMTLVYFQDTADITSEIIRRVDADIAATSKPAPTAAPPAPAAR